MLNTIGTMLNYVNWPTVILLLGLAFIVLLRKPLSEVVRRGGLKINREGITIDQVSAAVAVQSEPMSIEDTLNIDPETERRLSQVRQASVSVTIRNQQQRIRDDLVQLNLIGDKEETINVLIQHLAIAQLWNAAERLYRTIFGSQIALLKHLNLFGPATTDAMRCFYGESKSKYPEVYAGYSYEAYLSFLCTAGLIGITDNVNYSITPLGKDFLQWMTLEGVSDVKPF